MKKTIVSGFFAAVLLAISLQSGAAGIVDKVFVQAGSDAVSPTVTDKLRESVNVFNFMTAGQIAGVQSGAAMIDLTAPIQAAVNYAATRGNGLDGGGFSYGVRNVRLMNGLKFFRNFKLKTVTPGGQAILELAGFNYVNAPLGVQPLARNMVIEGNRLDCANISGLAIFGQSNTDIIVRDNEILNLPATNSNFAAIEFAASDYATGTAPSNITIHHNKITLPAIPSVLGFKVNGIVISGANQSLNPPAEYAATGRIPRPSIVATSILITDNTIVNGYYGVAVQGVDNSRIEGNTFTGQQRSVQMIDSSGNVVTKNRMINFNMSAVNCSFGSSNNNITKNFARRLIALEPSSYEAAFQSYVYARSNVFENNDVDTNARYAFYIGVDSGNGIVRNNRAVGGSLATIAVETDWVSGMGPGVPGLALYSRNSSAPQAKAPQNGVQVIGNAIYPNPSGAAIYFSCISPAGSVAFAQDTAIIDNVIYGTAAHYLYIVSADGANIITKKISSTKILRNTNQSGGAITESGVRK